MLTLTIKNEKSGPVTGFHPWVFSRAVIEIPEGLKAGEPVRLMHENGRFLATGYFNSYSQIAVRIWGYNEDEMIDSDFFEKRIKKAYQIRQRYIETPLTDAFRIVNGENDLLPGLIVDKYSKYLVVQFHTKGIEAWKDKILASLEAVFKPEGIYERSDMSVRDIEGLGRTKGLLTGKVPDIIEIKENGLRFLVDVKRGQKTGFFLDQRDKRHAFKKYTKDASVLNCFSYTGGFSVYAFAGGAQKVLNVDTSEDALELARKNIAINGFDLKRCSFIRADVKEYLKGSKERFDAIVLDPPAFIKDRKKQREGKLGYKSINEMAMRLLNNDGILLTCSCSSHLTIEEFRYILSEAGGRVRKNLRFLETYTHGIDHLQLVPFIEGSYLKCFIVSV